MAVRTLEVATGVYAVAASHCNFALVVEGTGVTLVDTGYPRDRDLIGASLAEIGRGLGDLEVVLLTHGHVDHLGSAQRLRRDHGLPVRSHAREVPNVRGEREEVISEAELARHAWRPKVMRFVLNAVAKGALTVEHVEEVEAFGDGATLDVPGRPVSVHTPGHTSGHVGFHLPERGVLLSGDALITVDVWDESDRGPQLIRPEFNVDHDRAVRSLDRLERIEADVVVPGHGRPYRGTPAQAVQEARARLA